MGMASKRYRLARFGRLRSGCVSSDTACEYSNESKQERTAKITDVKVRRLTGTMTYPGELWEERGAKPTDIYPVFRRLNVEDSTRRALPQLEDGGYWVTQMFLNVETDKGITGVVGPLTGDAMALYLLTQLRSLLIGQDPLATEYLWDVMYRNAPNGRSGDNMIAISHVDCAP